MMAERPWRLALMISPSATASPVSCPIGRKQGSEQLFGLAGRFENDRIERLEICRGARQPFDDTREPDAPHAVEGVAVFAIRETIAGPESEAAIHDLGVRHAENLAAARLSTVTPSPTQTLGIGSSSANARRGDGSTKIIGPPR